MELDLEFREPTQTERGMIDRLLEAEFPGKYELVQMMRTVRVRTIDEDGGLELQTAELGDRALVLQRIPVEAEAKAKDDRMTVHVLLHVVDGKPVELEIYRNDGGRVKELPSPSEFELIVLPPAPTIGWPDWGRNTD
jgi:hypothetical protein